MQEFVGNIETLTLENTDFRRVIYTGHHLQLVLMSLKAGEEIGQEIHHNEDQFFRIEQGKAKIIVADREHILAEDEVLIVPAGEQHNVINLSSQEDLKLYTIYSPKHHEDGTIHATKAEADAAEEDHHH